MTLTLKLDHQRRRQGTLSNAESPGFNVIQRCRAAFKRYLFYSGGIASATFGIAMLVTAVAVSYASSPQPAGITLAEASDLGRPVYFQYAADVGTHQAELSAPAEALMEAAAAELALAPGDDSPVESTPPRALLSVSTAGIRPNSVLTNVNVTFYDCLKDGFCGNMYNGEKVYEGAAACSWDLPIGTAFYIVGDPTGRVYLCKDRGLLDNTWVDIFWNNPVDGYAWQSEVGRFGTIVLVSLPE